MDIKSSTDVDVLVQENEFTIAKILLNNVNGSSACQNKTIKKETRRQITIEQFKLLKPPKY